MCFFFYVQTLLVRSTNVVCQLSLACCLACYDIRTIHINSSSHIHSYYITIIKHQILKMKVATVFVLLLASAQAFNAPLFATRAVGKAPATKAVKKAVVKKAVVKKVVAKKIVVKKVAAPKRKKAPRSKAPPASKGYPSFAEKAQAFSLGKGKISGGAAGKVITPVFVHPTVNTEPAPSFDYKEAAKARKTPQSQEFVFDDGLTVLERKQKAIIPAFLTGSARSRVAKSEIRTDIEEDIYPFGLNGDRFQLLFISVFSLFALVGCLSGNVSFD